MIRALCAVIGAASFVLVAPIARADAPIEGCHWDATGRDLAGDAGAWRYPDGTLCRGTGEDPTVDSHGRPVCADVDSVPVPRYRFGQTIYLCTQDPD